MQCCAASCVPLCCHVVKCSCRLTVWPVGGGGYKHPPPQPDKCACSTAPNETAKWSFLKIFNESLVPFQLKPYLMTNKRNMLI